MIVAHFRRGCKLVAGLFVLFQFATPSRGQVPDYTPDQLISILHRQIRATLGFPEAGSLNTTPPAWLSISTVGLEIEEGKPDQIDRLALVCPPPGPLLGAFESPQRIDQIYATILVKGQLGRSAIQVPGVDEALKKVVGPDGKQSKKALDYAQYKEAWLTINASAQQEADPSKKRLLTAKANDALRDWIAMGNKQEIDEAYNTLFVAATISANANAEWRINLLRAARGDDPSSDPLGSTAFPHSTLMPSVEAWKSPAGWFHLSYDSKSSSYTYDENKAHSSGSFSMLGIVSFGGEGGHDYKHEIKKASAMSYQFDLRRAVIVRDTWLDKRVFFEPHSWTWQTPGDVTGKPFPLVSSGSKDGLPQLSQNSEIESSNVAAPLFPVEVIVARNLKGSVTVTNSEYHDFEAQLNTSGSGSFLGIFKVGGGAGGQITHKDNQDGSVNIDLSMEGPIAIGFISYIIPQLPDPQKGTLVWGPNAWFPEVKQNGG